MLPQRRVLQSGKKKTAANDLPKFRETPMTQPEPRYYKEVFRTDKNIQQMHSKNPIAHTAPAPDAFPRAEAKTTARFMKSSIQMFPDQRDKDTFCSPAKRSNGAKNQFSTSI